MKSETKSKLNLNIQKHTTLVFLLSILLITGTQCGDGDVTYHKDIEPIMTDNCVSCHRSGNIAPFRLDTYDSVKTYAASSLASMAARTMPPWTVVNSGECGEFTETTWLKDEEIETFREWVQGDMEKGDEEDAPAAYKAPAALTTFTQTLSTPAYTPLQYYEGKTGAKHDGDGHDLPTDDYRCFLVDAGNTTDVFLKGFEVSSSSPKMAHHMILYSLTGDAITQAESLIEEGETGYTCFGGPGVDLDEESLADSGVTALAGWAPGTPPTVYPANSGVRISSDAQLVIQMHYNTENGIEEDVTDIKMIVDASTPKEAFLLPVGDYDMELAPGQTSVTTSTTFIATDVTDGFTGIDIDIYGVYPHMHKRGTSLKFKETTPGDKKCLTQVDTWDFDWQRFYFYEEPVTVTIQNDTAFELSCTYNTSDDTETVYWGDGTDDEMCLNFLYINVPICDSLDVCKSGLNQPLNIWQDNPY